MPDGDRGLVNRITRALRRVAGRGQASPTGAGEQSGDTSVTGTMTASLINAWTKSIFEISSERFAVYDDVKEMYDTVEEIETGLGKLSSTVLAGREGTSKTLEITFAEDADERGQAVITEMMTCTHLRDKSETFIREALLYGDKFLQIVIDRTLRIVRIMQMPVRSMHRNEDDTGLLQEGTSEGKWAFEQRYEKTNQFIAGFHPWQMIHLRWNKQGEDKYGRSNLYSARPSFKKLRAMEEALTINWLTRAFARLVFLLDHTGLPEEKRKQAIKAFQESLLTTKMADGSTGKDPLTVVKDIFLSIGYHQNISDDGKPMPELTDVKAVDTSTAGYRDLSPIKYYLRKVIKPLRIPPALLGIEDEVNAKATLSDQRDDYSAFIRWIQKWYSLYLVEIFDLALILQGIDPLTVNYEIVWPNPFKADELIDSRVELYTAQADKIRVEMGVVDATWIATRRMGMSVDEWAEVQARIAEQAQEVADKEAGVFGGDVEEFIQSGGVKGLLDRAAEQLTEEGLPITPTNVTHLLEQDGAPSKAYETAVEAYRQGLQSIYDKWAVETAEALADIDPDDTEEIERKLEDALLVLAMLLHQYGESNLDKAFYLGYGGREVGADGLRVIQQEIENNYYYLDNSLKAAIQERAISDLEDFKDEMRASRREEAIALLLAAFATRKARVDLYAGQYWHSIWMGWAQRKREEDAKKGEKTPVTWHLDPMARHCSQCPTLAGTYDSMQDLLNATGGILPGVGTECDGRCRCWLDEE